MLLYLGETTKNLFELGITMMVDPHSLTKGMSIYRDDSLHPPLTPKGITKLKRWGYLEERKITNKKKLCFTPKARVEIIRNILRNKKEKKLKWDGKWRAIIFDIPELTRKDRDFLRRELRWIGFKELQKSVWIFPYEIEKELIVLLRLWKIEFEGDIRFLTIEKMEDEDIQEHFNLE